MHSLALGLISKYPKMFDRLSIGTWMCLPLNHELLIKGKYAFVVSQTLEVSVSTYTNSSE